MDVIKKTLKETEKKLVELKLEIELFEKQLEDKYPVSLFISLDKFTNSLILHKIIIDKLKRNEGYGTKVMEEICSFADLNNLNIVLTPSKDYGSNKNRLICFYKKFSFKKNNNPIIIQTMIRTPKKSI